MKEEAAGKKYPTKGMAAGAGRQSALSEKRTFKSEPVQLINLGCQSSYR